MEITGTGELNVPEDPDHDRYMTAIRDFDATQDEFFATTKSWVNKPFDVKQTSALNGHANALANAFTAVADVVVNDERLTAEEKGHTLAAILLKADADRVELLSSLAPNAKIVNAKSSHEIVATDIAEDLEDAVIIIEDEEIQDDDELEAIVARVSFAYTAQFNADITMFTQTVKSENIHSESRRKLLRTVGGHLLKVGEVSVAVAVGVITAYELSKRASAD